jgi:hypothetical protein
VNRAHGEAAPYRYEIGLRIIIGADGLDIAEQTRRRLQDLVHEHGRGLLEVTSTVAHRNDLDHALADG